MEKQFIITSEFGDTYHHSGELPPEIVAAIDAGWAAVDVSDPQNPTHLNESGAWVAVPKLPG